MVRILSTKKAIVEQSMIAVLSKLARAGIKFFKAITRIVVRTIRTVVISRWLQAPSSLYMRFDRSLRPSIRILLGATEDHEKRPEQKDHQPADGKHVHGQLKEGYVNVHDILVESQGNGARARRREG